MKLLRAMAVTGLAMTLVVMSQAAFAQSGEESGWGEAREVKQEINQARAQGIDVSQAQRYDRQGRQALRNGDQEQASRYFEDAENALQDAGFESTQANEGTYSTETSSWGTSNQENYNREYNSGSGWSQAREVRRELDQARAQGIDVSEAEYYANRGRQELRNGNRQMANNDFNKAETALDNAGFRGAQARNEQNYNSGSYNTENYNSGYNSENSGWGNDGQRNTATNQSGWQQERALRRDINQAQSQGIDVSSAQDWLRRGRQAMQNGDPQQARSDFSQATNALSAAGFQSNQASNQGSSWGNYNFNAANTGANQSGWGQADQVRRDISQAQSQGIDVSDAQYYAQRGRQALQNNDTNKAASYFGKAETALQDAGFQGATARNNPSDYNENSNQSYNQGNYSQGNYNQGNNRWNDNRESNPTSYNGGNTPASQQAQQLRSDIDQAQAQGINVNDAIYYETQANDALRNGDENTARNDLNMAEQALQQAGYQAGQTSNQQAYNQMGQ